MTSQRLPILLTLVNLALLMFTLAQMRPAAAQDTAPMLRGRGLEIVDDHGRVRASIQVLPASTQKNGDRFPETVLLRLIDTKGLPHVKIATTEDGSALAPRMTSPVATINRHRPYTRAYADAAAGLWPTYAGGLSRRNR